MGDGRYAWEKLYLAVLCLASGSGSLQERIEDAYVSSLIRLHRPEHFFPWPELQERFIHLMTEIAPEGRADVALAQWSEWDLQRIAKDILGLYDRVTRHMEPLE